MSSEKKQQSDEPSTKQFNHGLDPKPGESFSSYSSRKSKEFESSSLIRSVLKYLELTSPALFMIHAIVLYVLSLMIGFLASKSVGVSFSDQNGLLFLSSLATFTSALAAMLIAWAIGRLIADAIKDGAKS